MSITTWCIIGMIASVIIGMIASVIIGFLRVRNREGTAKTIFIIIYTVVFIFFLLGAILSSNSDKNNTDIQPQGNDTQLTTYFKALEESADLGFTFTKTSENFLNEHSEYFTNDYNTLVHEDMEFIADYDDIMADSDSYGDKVLFLPAANVISISSIGESQTEGTMLELIDDENNYYLMISDRQLDGITEGIYVGGYYTPVGTVEFENSSGTMMKGIAGAVALL